MSILYFYLLENDTTYKFFSEINKAVYGNISSPFNSASRGSSLKFSKKADPNKALHICQVAIGDLIDIWRDPLIKLTIHPKLIKNDLLPRIGLIKNGLIALNELDILKEYPNFSKVGIEEALEYLSSAQNSLMVAFNLLSGKIEPDEIRRDEVKYEKFDNCDSCLKSAFEQLKRL